MASAPARRARRGPEEIRAALLKAATEEFARRRYREVTVKEIADSAQVSLSVTYRYFGTKAELFREATLTPLSETLIRFSERWRAQRDRPDSWYDREIAEQFMSELYRDILGHREALLKLAAADFEAEAVGYLASAINSAMDQLLLVAYAESAADRLWLPRENLDLALRLLVAMVFGATAFGDWLLPDSARSGSPDRVIQVLTDLTTWGLSSSAPPDGAPRRG